MMRHFPALLTVVFLCTTAAMAERPRLAIVASPGTNDAAALLTATLAGVEAFDLVERARLDAVAGELELELAGLTTQDALRLGRLLRANGLLHVTSGAIPDTKRVIWHLQLMAVEPGVVVWSMAMPSDADVDQWPQLVAERLVQASAKLQVAREAAVAVSVMGLHVEASQPGTVMDTQALRTLLTHRLVVSPHLFVLERSRLDLLVRERALAEGDLEPFWTGRYVLDGVLRPNDEPAEGEPWIAALSLRPPGHGQIHALRVPGDPDTPVAWADRMGRAVSKALAGSEAEAGELPVWDAAAEGQRLAREADWATATGAEPSVLIGLADSAAALGADEPAATRRRIEVRRLLLWPAPNQSYARRISHIWPGFDQRIAHGGRAEAVRLLEQAQTLLDLWLAVCVLPPDQWPAKSKPSLQSHVPHVTGSFLLYLQAHPDYPAPREQIERFRRTLRETAELSVRQYRADLQLENEGIIPMALHTVPWYAPAMYDSPQQAVDKLVEVAEVAVMNDRRELFRHVALNITRRHSSELLSTPLLPQWTQLDAQTQEAYHEQLIDRLTSHENPRVKLMGIRLSHLLRPQTTAMAHVRDQFWAMRDLFANGVIDYDTYSMLCVGYGGEHQSFVPPGSMSMAETSRRILIVCLDNRNYLRSSTLKRAFLDMYGFDRLSRLGLEEARELDEAMAGFAQKPAVQQSEVVSTVRGLREKIRQWQPDLPPMEEHEGEVLVVTRYWWPTLAEGAPGWNPTRSLGLSEASFHRAEEKLWFVGWIYSRDSDDLVPQSRSRVYQADLAAGISQDLPGPVWTRPEGYDDSLPPEAHVLVTPRWLYHVRWPWLDRYDRQSGQWQRIDGVFGAHRQPATDGQSVYLFTRAAGNGRHQALVRVDMASNAVTTLASTARPTPRTPLDDMQLSYTEMTVAPDGRLVVAANHLETKDRQFFAYDTAADRWSAFSASAASELVPGDFGGSGADVRCHFHARPARWQPAGRHWGSGYEELFLAWSPKGADAATERVRLTFQSPHWLQPDATAAQHPDADKVLKDLQRARLFTFYEIPEGLVVMTSTAHGFWFIPRDELP